MTNLALCVSRNETTTKNRYKIERNHYENLLKFIVSVFNQLLFELYKLRLKHINVYHLCLHYFNSETEK